MHWDFSERKILQLGGTKLHGTCHLGDPGGLVVSVVDCGPRPLITQSVDHWGESQGGQFTSVRQTRTKDLSVHNQTC